MPLYSFRCTACKTEYEQFRTISEGNPAACPSCAEPYGDSHRFNKAFDRLQITPLVYGNPQTIGQLAEENSRKMGKEVVKAASAVEQERASQWKGPVPDGCEVVDTSDYKAPWWRPNTETPVDIGKLTTPDKVRSYIEKGEVAA